MAGDGVCSTAPSPRTRGVAEKRGLAVGRHLDHVAFLHESLADEGCDLPLVFDHEDAHSGCRIAPWWRARNRPERVAHG